ncbi:hypothetical protein MTO96_039841 [Rhipicephalus appendiculatus]
MVTRTTDLIVAGFVLRPDKRFAMRKLIAWHLLRTLVAPKSRCLHSYNEAVNSSAANSRSYMVRKLAWGTIERSLGMNLAINLETFIFTASLHPTMYDVPTCAHVQRRVSAMTEFEQTLPDFGP